MLYRDYMQKFRPLYSPDEGGAPAPGVTAAPVAPAAPEAAPAVAGPEAAAAPAPVASEAPAPAAAEPAPAATERPPSLIESATRKPKPEAVAAKPAEGAGAEIPAKEEPAPAATEKTDAEKTAEAAAGAKPKDPVKTEAELKAEADAAAATDPANKDATAAAQPPAPIKYEAFKVPEGVKLDDERIGKFAEIAGPAQVPQDVAQKFVDLHLEEIQRVAAEMQQQAVDNQRKTWNTYVDTITSELRKDPELGGNRLETSLSMAKAVVEEYLPAGEASEYLALLSHNGMGNHRLQVKLLHEIGRKLNIFEDGLVPANPQTPKMQKSPGNRGWYDKNPGRSGVLIS